MDQSWHADFFVRNFRARHIIEEDATAYVRRECLKALQTTFVWGTYKNVHGYNIMLKSYLTLSN